MRKLLLSFLIGTLLGAFVVYGVHKSQTALGVLLPEPALSARTDAVQFTVLGFGLTRQEAANGAAVAARTLDAHYQVQEITFLESDGHLADGTKVTIFVARLIIEVDPRIKIPKPHGPSA